MPKAPARAPQREAPKPRPNAVAVERVDWLASSLGAASGYGNVAQNAALAIEALGTIVRIVGDPNPTGPVSAAALAISTRVDRNIGDALVLHADPLAWFRDPDRPTYGMTTCLTDRLPLTWNAKLTTLDEIWIPSNWCADTFAAATTKPVFVIPLGVDAEAFPFSRRSRGSRLRFLHFQRTPEVRKGADLAIAAFQLAFPHRDDVELVLRSTLAGDLPPRNDPRISIDVGVMTTDALSMYYRSFDALVAPSRSEAFGLVPLEAMSTGMPAIFPDATGCAEYRDLGLPVSARSVPATVSNGRANGAAEAPWGRWTAPDIGEIADRMREIDIDYDRVMATAESDAAAIAENWTWHRTAAAIVARLNA
jgi:glycosyltransferase involved in cell wall biosynthesis